MKITKIILNIIPVYLSKVFKELWNKRFENDEWQSNGSSGKLLHKKLPNIRIGEVSKVITGVEHDWDTALLTYILLEPNLDLTNGNSKLQNQINTISKTRNTLVAHSSKMSCTTEEFTQNMEKLKSVAKDLLGEDAEMEIVRIENSRIHEGVSEEEKQRMQEEFEQSLQGKLVSLIS